MTFQLTSFEQVNLSLSQPLHSSLKHRADYAAIVRKLEGDLVGAIECASTAVNVLEASDDSWHREWFIAGEAGLKRAQNASKAGNLTDARDNWRRAAIYFSAAELYLPYDDSRRIRTVDKLETSCRDYIESLTPAGAVVGIPTPDGSVHEAYLVRNADPKSPVVICVGGCDELKESLIPLTQPALAWGLPVLLVEAPPTGATIGRGYDRFAMATFLMACIDHIWECDEAGAHPVAIYGVGAGASFASEAAEFDDRVCAIAGDFVSVRGLRNCAVVRSFIGSDRAGSTQDNASVNARRVASVIDALPEMTAIDIFDQIARRVAGDRT